MARIYRITVGLAAAATLAVGHLPAVAQPIEAAQPLAAEMGAGYILGPRDVVNVQVVGRADFNMQVQVQDDGTIVLPLIGSITASNRTVLQLKSDIEQRLRSGGYFVRPEVLVTLITASSQYAVLLGEVATPGLMSLDRNYRLSELIARAGGARTGADAVTVTLPTGDSREFSLRAIATNQSPDPLVSPGTKVFVQPAELFYIYGQVGGAGSYPVEPEMTVRKAIARAGGLGALGSKKKIRVYRGDKVLKRVKLDMKLEPGDTIYVGERFF